MLLKDICAVLKDFQVITKQLQDPTITLDDVRLIFDEVIQVHPSMADSLKADAKIVKHPLFESGICKVLRNEIVALTSEEKTLLGVFEQDVIVVDDAEERNLTIVQRALKRRKAEKLYADLSFIPPTSNVCERLFSSAR